MTLSAFFSKTLTTTLLGGSLMLASGTASAASPDGERGAREGKAGGKICRVAECNEDQRERVSAIRAATKKTVKSHKAALKAGKERLAKAFGEDDFNAAEARRIEAEMDGHRDAIRAAKSDALVEIHGVLRPEQRDAVSKHMLERKGKGKKHKAKGKRGKGKAHAKGHDKKRGKGKAKGKSKTR